MIEIISFELYALMSSIIITFFGELLGLVDYSIVDDTDGFLRVASLVFLTMNIIYFIIKFCR